MNIIIIGLGVQGKKRRLIAGNECIATIDVRGDAQFRTVEEVPLEIFDAAIVSTPDTAKPAILEYLLSHGKHVLVEKPLLTPSPKDLLCLQELARSRGLLCMTAYNHRFEPHFIRMKQLIDSGTLGKLYHCRLFYGNGTARDVRSSPWRDRGSGVLSDLGSHLLNTLFFWFGDSFSDVQLERCHRFENASPDYVRLSAHGTPEIDLEITLLSWRNHFACDLIGEHGSAHIDSLCKWGPSTFTIRSRKLPSGRPDEETVTLVQPDPTWAAEYAHFKEQCKAPYTDLLHDIAIQEILEQTFPTPVCI